MASLAGRRFGRLVAVVDVGSVRNGKGLIPLWECRCDCGKVVNKRSSQLLQGRVRSCGCLRSDVARAKVLLPPGVSGFRALLRRYRASARRKGLAFSLTEPIFRSLVTADCHYCGAPPAQASVIKQGSSVFIYNGVDRYDNTRGYTRQNSVSCCTGCNRLKGALGGDQFLAKIFTISNHVQEALRGPA